MPATLTKAERLSGKVAIGRLMSEGRWGHSQHFKYCVLRTGSAAPAEGAATEPAAASLNRIMVSVPKKLFKRAVKRNLLKRRIRESYRTQKDLLAVSGVDILFFYNTPEVLPFAEVKAEVAEILQRIK